MSFSFISVEKHRCERPPWNLVYLQIYETSSKDKHRQSENSPTEVPSRYTQVGKYFQSTSG